jgi:hypothetical protein
LSSRLFFVHTKEPAGQFLALGNKFFSRKGAKKAKTQSWSSQVWLGFSFTPKNQQVNSLPPEIICFHAKALRKQRGKVVLCNYGLVFLSAFAFLAPLREKRLLNSSPKEQTGLM